MDSRSGFNELGIFSYQASDPVNFNLDPTLYLKYDHLIAVVTFHWVYFYFETNLNILLVIVIFVMNIYYRIWYATASKLLVCTLKIVYVKDHILKNISEINVFYYIFNQVTITKLCNYIGTSFDINSSKLFFVFHRNFYFSHSLFIIIIHIFINLVETW